MVVGGGGAAAASGCRHHRSADCVSSGRSAGQHGCPGTWSGPKTDYDFFSFYKAASTVSLAVAALAAVVAVRRAATGAFPPAFQLALVALYTALALASALTSPYPAIVWQGFAGRYEGFWVLASYLALMVSSYALFDEAVKLRTLAWCLACSSMVISGIGLLQRARFDPFRTRLGRTAILPSAFTGRIESVIFRLPDGQIYSTLGHYNYVGSYAVLVLPLLVVLALSGERTSLRVVSRVAAGMLAAVWIACGSRAGLVGGACAAVALLVALRHVWLKYTWRVAAGVLVVLAVTLLARPRLFGRAATSAGAGIANLLSPVGEAERARFESLPVRAASVVDDQLRLETRRGELVVVNHGGTLSVADATGRPLEVFVETATNRVSITDERFSGFELLNGTLNGRPVIVVQQGPFLMRFLLTAGGFEYVSEGGRPLPLSAVASWGGTGHEDAASARVYIWSRTIPLLRNTLVMGYGPDTFAAAFPQQDFVGKYLAYGTSEMLVDKPHNFYLQTALSSGVLSMIVLMGLFLSYARASGRAYWSQFLREEAWFTGLGCFAGIVGYLGAGIFNDSAVSVAPVFWVLIGAGMRANTLHGMRHTASSSAVR